MLQKLKNLIKKNPKIQNLPIENNTFIKKTLPDWAEYLFIKSYVCPKDVSICDISISEFYSKLENCDIKFLAPGHLLFEKYFDNSESITCPVCQRDYMWNDFRKYMVFNDRTNQFVCRECVKNNN